MTLGFPWNSSNTTMYCLDIKLLSKREKELLREQIKTMYIDGNNNATIKYQLFSLNVYVIQREFLDLTMFYNELILLKLNTLFNKQRNCKVLVIRVLRIN